MDTCQSDSSTTVARSNKKCDLLVTPCIESHHESSYYAYCNTIKLLPMSNAATEATNSLVEHLWTGLQRLHCSPWACESSGVLGRWCDRRGHFAILCSTDRIRYAWHSMHSCGIADIAVFWHAMCVDLDAQIQWPINQSTRIIMPSSRHGSMQYS